MTNVDTKLLIEIVSLVIAFGSMMRYMVTRDATTKEQIKTLFKRMDDKEEKDKEQDKEIKEVRNLATTTNTNVAVINERTKNMDTKLDQLLAKE